MRSATETRARETGSRLRMAGGIFLVLATGFFLLLHPDGPGFRFPWSLEKGIAIQGSSQETGGEWSGSTGKGALEALSGLTGANALDDSSGPAGVTALEDWSRSAGVTALEDWSRSAGAESRKDRSSWTTGEYGRTNSTGHIKSIPPTFSSPEVVSFAEPWRLIRVPSPSDLGACYRKTEGLLDGRRQVIHVLVVETGSERISVRPVLSFDRLFGYETLGVMAERAGALAAINGGFGPADGRPAGMVMLDGVLLHPADARFPTLLIGEKKVSLAVIRTSIRLNTEKGEFPADFLNPWPLSPGWAVFTPIYGSTDRVEVLHRFVSVSNGMITKVGRTDKPAAIPEDGFLLVSRGTEQEDRMNRQFHVGDPLSWTMAASPELPENVLHAMSCGSFLVREGKNVAPEADPWAGSLTGPAPRTAVGIGPDGQLAFLVAEGRNPKGASGLTGKELGGFLVSMGIREAALLDGGASSEIMTAGEVRNFLSAGRERLLPSGFVFVPHPVADRGN